MGEGRVGIEAAGEALTALPERALWWRARRTLIVSDMHLGKSETLRVAGLPIPDGDTDEQLDRLERLVHEHRAIRVVVVGDLIHAGMGLTDALVARVGERLGRLAAGGTVITLVVGNHDRKIAQVADAWDLDVAGETLREGPIEFCHAPCDRAGAYVISGHLHPLVRLEAGLRLPAFWFTEGFAVLPAFSRFTGGVSIDPEAGDRVLAIVEDRVVDVTRPSVKRVRARRG